MDNEDMLQADSLPAAKGDLKAFATKTALERFATTADLAALRDEMAAFRREAGLAYVQLTADLNAGTARILGEFASFRSQILHLTGDAVSKADFGMQGQTILGHRVDELEKRVSVLESAPPRS